MTPRTKRSAVVVALALVTLLAAAWPQVADAHRRGRGGPFRAMLSHLDLTDAQKEQIKAILAAERPRLEPLVGEAARARRALFAAVTAPTFDESAVRAAADAAGKAAGALAVERARVGSMVRGLLTPEQQAKLDERLQRFRERHERRGRLGRTIWREHAADFVDAL